MSTSQDLLDWATNHRNRGAQAEFARRVSAALNNEDEATTWSMIDLRREFDARAVETGFSSVLIGGISGLSFIVPVMVAWIHLHSVFSQFRDAVAVAGKGEQINFLAYWTGGYTDKKWAFNGTPASTVALQVIIAVAAVVALQALVAIFDVVGSAREARLSDLITDASLQFAKKRAIRPEELAGEIRVAAEELERGLANLTTAFEHTRSLVDEVQGFTGQITESAATLKESTDELSRTMEPLSRFGAVASDAEKALGQAVEALVSAEQAFAAGVRGNSEVMQGAQSMFSSGVRSNVAALETASSEVTGALDAVKAGVNSAAGAVSRAAEGLSSVVANSVGISSSVATTARELGGVIEAFGSVARDMGAAGNIARAAASSLESVVTSADSPHVRSYILAVESVAQRMADSAAELVETVKHMSVQLRKWTEDGR